MKKTAPPPPATLARHFCALAAFALVCALGQAHTARAQWVQPSGSSHINNTNTGNVGIGTGAAAPAKRLDVNGSIFAGNSISLGKGVTDYAGIGFNRDADTGTILDPLRGAYQIHDATGRLFFTAYTPAGTLIGYPLTFDGANVGVGVGNTAPAARLQVNGAGGYAAAGSAEFRLFNSVYGGAIAQHLDNFGNWQLYDTATSATKIMIGPGGNGPINFYSGAGNVVVNGTGNVGIGTTAPGAKLDVNGAIRTSGPFGFSIGNDLNRPRIEIQQSGNTFYFLTAANGAAPVNVGGLAVTNSFPANPPANGLYVQGKVRVGTSADTAYQLDVTGAANVTGDVNVTGTITGGNITAKYQDVAEWVPTKQRLAAGTVVVLDTRHSNHVVASAAAYDTRVAGVISAQPGISLGEAGEGKVLVATTGRVKVKVDASRAPIQIGDLIVTSDVAGVAMRSEAVSLGGVMIHRPGTIIGKALEPLAGGTGEILVLLSMQ